MSADDPIHLNRARAEAFGAVAADYDRYRPGYPDELIDDLVALLPKRVLDVGCGTGKAARLLVARGVPVLGVEIDPEMAAVARSHGIDVEVGRFEDWAEAGRRFDLIISAQAWHWVDPARGAPKAARLLDTGGTLALFWNYDDPDAATRAAMDTVYTELAPQLRSTEPPGPNQPEHRLAELRGAYPFASVETRTYEWHKTLPVEEFVGVLGTQSAHLTLGAERLAAVLAGLRAELARLGETVRLTGGTYTIWARP